MASIIMQGRIHAPTRHRAIVRIRHSRTGSAFRHATAARRRLQGRLRASHGWTDAEGDNLVVVSMRSDDSKYEGGMTTGGNVAVPLGSNLRALCPARY